MADISHSITTILTNAFSIDKTTRESAEKSLEQLALSNFPELLFKLASELSDESQPVKIRQLSATYIKNSITREDLKEVWVNKMDHSIKDQIKNLILSTLATNFKEVRTAAGIVISGICRVDLPLNEKWPTLISSLCQNSYHENINISLAAIESLGYVCEELSLKSIDANTVDGILSAIITNLANHIDNTDIVKYCLKALFHTVRLAEKNFASPNEMKIIMEAIFSAAEKNVSNDEILEKTSLIFIEIASYSNYYDYIVEYIQKIADFSFYVIKQKSESNEKLTLLAIEFWCTLGGEEISRQKTELTSLITNMTNKKPFRKYMSIFFTTLMELIIFRMAPIEDEEDNEWSYSKACSYILHILVQVVDYEMMETILKYVEEGQVSEDSKTKVTSLLIFAVCCDSQTHKIRILDFINTHINKVVKFLFSSNNRVKTASSVCLVKIAKHFGKAGVFDPHTLNQTIPALINAMPSGNKIAINICQTLIHIIKSVGDSETVKNSNPLSTSFEKIFSELLTHGFRARALDKDSNLTVNCFLAINALIEYSSCDKQEKLSEILVYFLSQFENTFSNTITTTIQNLAGDGVTDAVFLLQSYYCTVFRSVFKKLMKKLSNEIAMNIYTLIENSFKLRQTVYDEAILAMGALVENVREGFEPIMEKFQDYLLYAINKTDESSLCKTGILVLGNITRIIGYNIHKYSDKFIPALLSILTNDNVSRYCKTVAITTIGEICLAVNEHFLKYFEMIMNLFISAASLAATHADSEDEDTEEYLKDLRFELIEAFTFISFGLDDCGKKELFIPYVPKIFDFFKVIIEESYQQRADILKSMLSFVNDMANCFGKEILSICNKDFVSTIITKLKAFKLKRYEVEVSQQEQCLSLLFG